jgi:hypothetical protein
MITPRAAETVTPGRQRLAEAFRLPEPVAGRLAVVMAARGALPHPAAADWARAVLAREAVPLDRARGVAPERVAGISALAALADARGVAVVPRRVLADVLADYDAVRRFEGWAAALYVARQTRISPAGAPHVGQWVLRDWPKP